jgi:hypothetical protein
MEQRFGQDFSAVRVHTDAAAARTAEALDAEAFTHGRDVAFGPQRYAPRTGAGRALLAHELAHVIQQSRGGAQRAESPSLEAGADRAAAATGAPVAGVTPVAVAGASAVGVARKKKRQKPPAKSQQKSPPSRTGPAKDWKPEVSTVAEADKMWGGIEHEMKSEKQASRPGRRRSGLPESPEQVRARNVKLAKRYGPQLQTKDMKERPALNIPKSKGAYAFTDRGGSQGGLKRNKESLRKWKGHEGEHRAAFEAHNVRSGRVIIRGPSGQPALKSPAGVRRKGKSSSAQGEDILSHEPKTGITHYEDNKASSLRRKGGRGEKVSSAKAIDPRYNLRKNLLKSIKATGELHQLGPRKKIVRQLDRAHKDVKTTGKLKPRKDFKAGVTGYGGQRRGVTSALEKRGLSYKGPFEQKGKPKAPPPGPSAAQLIGQVEKAGTTAPAKTKPARPGSKAGAKAGTKRTKKGSTKARNPKARGKPSPKATGKLRAKPKSKMPRSKLRGRGGKYVGAGIAFLGLMAATVPAFAATKPSEPIAEGAPPTSATGPQSTAAAPAGPGSAPDPAMLADVAETLDTGEGTESVDAGMDDAAQPDASAATTGSEAGEPDQAPGAPGAETAPSKLDIAGDILSASGVLLASLPLKGKAGKIGGGIGTVLQVAGLGAKLKDMHSKGASKTEMAEAAWGAVAQGAASHVIPTGPAGMAVNIANAGAQALGAPQGVQDSLSIASDLVPSNMAGQSIATTGPMLAHAATGNWKEFDRGADNIMAGQAGPALQGYFGVVTLGVDALSGKDMWKSLNEVTNKGKGSVADRVGSYLGDETYKFINRDLPEAAEFAAKDMARLKKQMGDAKSAVTRRAGAMVDAARGAAEGTIAPVREKTTAMVNTVKRGVEQKVDAVTQGVAQKVKAAEGRIEEVKNAASEQINEAKSAITDAVDAAAGKAASAKEGFRQGIAEARNAVTAKAAPIRNKISALLDKPWF